MLLDGSFIAFIFLFAIVSLILSVVAAKLVELSESLREVTSAVTVLAGVVGRCERVQNVLDREDSEREGAYAITCRDTARV
jgi:hypothetical protein